MKQKGKLKNGRIPQYTECPFKEECCEHINSHCAHNGKNHKVEFSCGYARAFNLIDLYHKVK